ncbi:MAG TPA: hypothetical protein VJO99_03340 [Burkholderiaceae bacterium]|nr:hypothetical protein [Burkholderiaceae bacterium]
MTTLVQPSAFLRRVLLADAVFSIAGGALMAFGAALLAGPTGIPTSLLLSAGLALFPYAAYVAWLATRRAVPRAAVWVPIVLNVVWAADCALVLFGGRFAPTMLGELFVGAQIVAVLAFAELQFVGLRRANALMPD